MLKTIALFSITCAAVVAAPLQAKTLEERKWVEVRTANFAVRSAIGEKKAIKLARNLEYFRAAVGKVSNISSTESYIPTRVYAVKNVADFRELGVSAQTAGFIRATQRNYNIVLREVSGMSETGIILHEYVHYLIRNHNGLQYPKWFDEGFAEYLGASSLRGKYFKLGVPNTDRSSTLSYGRRLEMSKILRAAEDYDDWSDAQQSMFYAQAWALVHYLQVELQGELNFTAAMARYLELSEAGLPGDEAFEGAFGLSPDDLGTAVNRYLERGRFGYLKIRAAALIDDFNYTVRSISREEVALGLADIAAYGGERETAQRLYAVAAESPPQAGPARLRSGLLQPRQDFERLEAQFDAALVLCPDNPYCQLDYANYWFRRAGLPGDKVTKTAAINLARQHYVKAWQLDDTIPEIYAAYGESFLTGEYDVGKAVEMLEEAEYLLKSNLQIRYQLGRAYMAAERDAEAIEALRSVVVWSHSESGIAGKAKLLLAQLLNE